MPPREDDGPLSGCDDRLARHRKGRAAGSLHGHVGEHTFLQPKPGFGERDADARCSGLGIERRIDIIYTPLAHLSRLVRAVNPDLPADLQFTQYGLRDYRHAPTTREACERDDRPNSSHPG